MMMDAAMPQELNQHHRSSSFTSTRANLIFLQVRNDNEMDILAMLILMINVLCDRSNSCDDDERIYDVRGDDEDDDADVV